MAEDPPKRRKTWGTESLDGPVPYASPGYYYRTRESYADGPAQFIPETDAFSKFMNDYPKDVRNGMDPVEAKRKFKNHMRKIGWDKQWIDSPEDIGPYSSFRADHSSMMHHVRQPGGQKYSWFEYYNDYGRQPKVWKDKKPEFGPMFYSDSDDDF
jgi:hypothetical protein